METIEIDVETGARPEVADLTEAAARFVRGRGDGLLSVFVIGASLTVPVLGGSLALGTWQSIVLVDTNVDNRERRVRLSFLAG